MAKKAYIGVNGVARKIKRGYIGIDGVARKIKRAYIGVGGVARPCWSGGELTYYGTITPLSSGVENLASASIPGLALFACGQLATGTGTNRYSKAIDVYDKALTRNSLNLSNMVVAGTQTTTSLTSREFLSGGSVNETAIFAGGSRGETYLNDVFSVNTSLTLSRVPSGQYLQNDSASHAVTPVGNHVLFANGKGLDRNYYKTVEAYDASLTKKMCETTTNSEGFRAATTVDNRGVIAGGQFGQVSYKYDKTIDVYDSSLTKITMGIELSVGRSNLSAKTINGNALFVGGLYYSDRYNVVDSYNESLTHSTAVEGLSVARCNIAAEVVEDLAVFIGGEDGSGRGLTAVDAYDKNLVKTVVPQLTEGRCGHAVAKTGDYLLVGGGRKGGATYTGYASDVDAFVYS